MKKKELILLKRVGEVFIHNNVHKNRVSPAEQK